VNAASETVTVATGAHAVSAPIDGSGLDAVFTMHDMDHARALRAYLTVAELERLDLAYAPPFSPVRDPILVAAKVLHGKLQTDEPATAQ